MKGYLVKAVRLSIGLILFSFGIYCSIQANIGLGPWEAFSSGISTRTGLSFGTATILVSVIVLAADIALREKIGLGTLLNATMVGLFVDIMKSLQLLPLLHNLFAGIGLLLLGQVAISVGSYFYIGSALGCGPRDSLMVALCKRLPRLPIGAVRGGMEGVVLLIGWAMGAKVGIGTVVAVFGIGFIIQFVFRILRFDVKAVEHESLLGTWEIVWAKARPAAKEPVPQELQEMRK